MFTAPVPPSERLGKPLPANLEAIVLRCLAKSPAERYQTAYFTRFKGGYATSDEAVIDTDGQIWVLGRTDDVINVAAHRISTMEIESAAASEPGVAEVAVIDQIPNNDPQKKLILDYRDSFTKKFGKPPSPFGALVYDAFSAVTSIMAKVGDDKDKIRAGLENLKGHLGAAGIYTTSPAYHNGFLVDSMRMIVVEKAAFKLAPR